VVETGVMAVMAVTFIVTCFLSSLKKYTNIQKYTQKIFIKKVPFFWAGLAIRKKSHFFRNRSGSRLSNEVQNESRLSNGSRNDGCLTKGTFLAIKKQ